VLLGLQPLTTTAYLLRVMPAIKLLFAGTKNICPGTRMARSYRCPAISCTDKWFAKNYPLCLAACPLHDAIDIHRTGLPRDLAAAGEHRERGNAADVVARREFLSLLGV
jgi:hypothetical protein